MSLMGDAVYVEGHKVEGHPAEGQSGEGQTGEGTSTPRADADHLRSPDGREERGFRWIGLLRPDEEEL
jgi:hypothetical protein